MKYVCPYCFEVLKTESDFYAICNNKSVAHRYIPSKLGNSESETNRVEFRINKKNSNYKYRCKWCEEGIKVMCGKCMNTLPESDETLAFAFCGEKASGKTYVTSKIINALEASLRKINNASGVTPDSKIIYLFDKDNIDGERYRRLQSAVQNEEIMGTEYINIDVSNVKEFEGVPILYRVEKRMKTGLLKTSDMCKYTLNFIDKAGEIFENETLLEQHAGPYITSCSVFIILIDPTNFQAIQELLASENINCKKKTGGGKDNAGIITRIADLYNRKTKSKKGKIDIPVIVTFSKWDYIEQLKENKPDGYSMDANSVVVNGKFSERQFESNSGLIRKFLCEKCGGDADKFVTAVEQKFTKVYYSACSAYGTSTTVSKDGVETRPKMNLDQSRHLDDGILWMLSQKGIIPKI